MFEWDDSCPDRFYAHFMKKMTGKAIMKNIKTNFSKQRLIIAVALLIALPVRVYQYLHVIDGTTGFYNTWSNPTVFGLYGLCALVIILVVALSLKNSKKTIYAMPVGKKTSVGIASLAAAIAFLVESGYNAYRVFLITSGQLTQEQLVIGDNIGKPTLVFMSIQVLFGILSTAFFALLAVSFLSGKEQYKKAVLLAVSPVIWGVARLMIGFTQTISYRYVSELLFDLFMIVFMCMFGVAFAKMCAGVLENRVQMRLFAYGILAAFFALLSAVPRYIMVLMSRLDVLYRQTGIGEVTDLVLPIFIMVMIFAIAATKQYKSVEEYSVEETAQGE